MELTRIDAAEAMRITVPKAPAALFTPSENDPHWYALAVAPQKEYTVAAMLRDRGVRTFVPTETRFRRRSRHVKHKAEFAYPVIPGTIFAGFDGPPHWYEINRNPLILGPFGMDGQPWRLAIDGRNGLFSFFARALDGYLVMEHGVRLVYVQGRGPIRAPTTQVKTVSRRNSGALDVVEPKGERLDMLRRIALPVAAPGSGSGSGCA